MELNDIIMLAAASLYNSNKPPYSIYVGGGKCVFMTSYEEAVYHAKKLWDAVLRDKFNSDGTINEPER